MSLKPKAHEIYRHFKGNLYQIIAVAVHSETGEELVIYQALYGDYQIYARPLDLFLSRVDKGKYPASAQEFRFELQNGEDPRKTEAERKEQSTQISQAGGAQAHTAKPQEHASEPDEEWNLDPLVAEYLDAGTYEERLNILVALHHRITDDMITTMALASDVEVLEGDLETRYEGLKSCLLTQNRYESRRIR